MTKDIFFNKRIRKSFGKIKKVIDKIEISSNIKYIMKSVGLLKEYIKELR